MSGYAAPSDSRNLEAFPSPVSLWLQVVIPYFKNRVQLHMCQNTEIDFQKVNDTWSPGSRSHICLGQRKYQC